MKKETSNKEKASVIRALINAGWTNGSIRRFMGFKNQNDFIKFLKENKEASNDELFLSLTLYFNQEDIERLNKIKEKTEKSTYLEVVKELILEKSKNL